MADRNTDFYHAIPLEVPRTPHGLLTRFFRWFYSLIGWRFLGNMPAIHKAVVILVPHTSNWDFFIAVCAKFALRLRASYIMKQEAFFWPFRNWLIGIGGIPVDRSQPHLVVNQVGESLQSHEGNWLVITPEGTRKKVSRYKTGFLRIAYAANIPVVVAGFDYQKKAIIFSKVVQPSSQFETEAEELHQFCRTTFVGKHPENQ